MGRKWTKEEIDAVKARYANEPSAALAASIGRTVQFAQPDAAGRSVKYRHPQGMMTWSGRGKPPAWVKVWLEQGKTLDDLLVEKAAAPA